MRFEEALKCMREGKKVCNSNKPTDVYRMNDFGHLEIINDNFPDGCHSSISGDDIFAEDWEVVEDNGKQELLGLHIAKFFTTKHR